MTQLCHNQSVRDLLIELSRPVVRKQGLGKVLAEQEYDFDGNAHAPDVSFFGPAKLPLLERVRFLAIFSQNLDDFFQVRVAGLKEQVLAAVAMASPDGMSPLEQLRAIRTRVEGLVQRQMDIFNDELVPALASAGISLVRGESRYCSGRRPLRIFLMARVAIVPGSVRTYAPSSPSRVTTISQCTSAPPLSSL